MELYRVVRVGGIFDWNKHLLNKNKQTVWYSEKRISLESKDNEFESSLN